MKSIVRALARAAIAVAPAVCVAQIVRAEVYPIAYDEKAHAAAQKAVKEFLAATLLAL